MIELQCCFSAFNREKQKSGQHIKPKVEDDVGVESKIQ